MGKRSRKSVPRIALHIAWKVETKTQVVGLAVHDDDVYAGNDKGELRVLSKADGALRRTFNVPRAVRCIVVDKDGAYAGCNDGNIYDIAGDKPRVKRRLAPEMGIDWIEIHRGRLYAADHEGGLTAWDVEGNVLWQRRDDIAREGWMVRVDDSGVYHGCSVGLRAYNDDGAPRFSVTDVDDVRFGCISGDHVVGTGGWMARKSTSLFCVTKAGRLLWKRPLTARKYDDWKPTGAEACAAGHDGTLYGSTGNWLFAYDKGGQRLWEAPTGCGSACNMVVDGAKLFIGTSAGDVACLDLVHPQGDLFRRRQK